VRGPATSKTTTTTKRPQQHQHQQQRRLRQQQRNPTRPAVSQSPWYLGGVLFCRGSLPEGGRAHCKKSSGFDNMLPSYYLTALPQQHREIARIQRPADTAIAA
ncbi:unnamed protein product, partial [Ectocarpus sp. 12 AP-2014]